jgi:hypothetical protein
MLKRQALDSPDVAFSKRRCMLMRDGSEDGEASPFFFGSGGTSENAPACAREALGALGTDAPASSLAQAQAFANAHAGAYPHAHMNPYQVAPGLSGKRRRGEESPGDSGSEAARLRDELRRVTAEAINKVAQVELMAANLKRACEDQQKELQRVHQENKLLKRSVLALNGRREEAEREGAACRAAADQLARKCDALERANVALCMQKNAGINAHACGGNWWGDGGGGGGPIF